jgi:hypothetical protein
MGPAFIGKQLVMVGAHMVQAHKEEAAENVTFQDSSLPTQKEFRHSFSLPAFARIQGVHS